MVQSRSQILQLVNGLSIELIHVKNNLITIEESQIVYNVVIRKITLGL